MKLAKVMGWILLVMCPISFIGGFFLGGFIGLISNYPDPPADEAFYDITVPIWIIWWAITAVATLGGWYLVNLTRRVRFRRFRVFISCILIIVGIAGVGYFGLMLGFYFIPLPFVLYFGCMLAGGVLLIKYRNVECVVQDTLQLPDDRPHREYGLRCSYCRLWKTEECRHNPAGADLQWASESFACFVPKGQGDGE
jgi:hypothetical protein